MASLCAWRIPSCSKQGAARKGIYLTVIFFLISFSASGVGFLSSLRWSTVKHYDPAAHQDHCGRCRIQTRDPGSLVCNRQWATTHSKIVTPVFFTQSLGNLLGLMQPNCINAIFFFCLGIHSLLFRSSLFCSKLLKLKSGRERFAQVTYEKRATMSESLRSLFC